ncbi:MULTISPECIES: nicotinate-nucleotide--dimethylbenzimidazole phosphoribosyltransferase [unclassified Minwuia]|jgi:nicotinate-nucleotide--dimethylbenzimidazole phosphoribosyltransferase|uniref:nicotinate-nucleotide--dimethylbenzimidazole phosphoribosyltransferase n=1 Tax=unclassified Minwuia TaxID=2618799 RepID=UPI00247B1CCF|nr:MULTISPECIES: nicotinate-nucleotide--dimethylbenzimidazole phosphoribosyltransferase [unclassified Minwuia]
MKPDTLDHLRGLIADLPPSDDASARDAAARQDNLVKPAGSLGRLEEIAVHMARWQGTARPAMDRARTIIFAGSHGMTKHGVSAFPDEVNAQMLAGFGAGFAAICQLTQAFGAELSVVDCGIATPTADFTTQPAMDESAFLAAVAMGMDAVRGTEDLLVFGEMGIGNTTAAAAVALALFGGEARDWVGPGTGVDDAGIARKADVIARARAIHGADLDDPLLALSHVGGRELAAIFGACLAARRHRIPVLLDGFIVTSAVAPLHRIAGADGLAHTLAAHQSGEPGHQRLLARLGLDPLLALGMRLGEGSGAATALGLVRAALACHNGMATFAEAAVAGSKQDT